MPTLPQHIAFIMDGNGRWAQARNLPRLEGHRKGVAAMKGMIAEAGRLGINYVTFYAFSVENWKRSQEEVGGLMEMARLFFRSEFENLMKQNIQVRFIGDRSAEGRLPKDIVQMMVGVEERTRANTGLTVVFAINYGGRDEIVRAAQMFAEDVDAARRYASDFDEEVFSEYLDTIKIPDPDLVIRTGGERRLSNFLLWQSAYAELYFTDAPWPDFDAAALQTALEDYTVRERRFGAVAG